MTKKALFFNLPGATGHLNPTLPIVQSLIQQGHQVTYYCGPESKNKVEQIGATYKSYLPYTDYLHKEIEGKNILLDMAEIIIKLSEQISKPLIDDLKKENFDYVMYTSLCLWGKQIAKKFEIPGIMIGSLPVIHPLFFLNDMTIFNSFIKTIFNVSSVINLVTRTQNSYKKLDIMPMAFYKQIFDLGTNEADMNIITISPKFHPYSNFFKDKFHFVGPSFTPNRDQIDFEFSENNNPIIYVSLGTVVNNKPEFFRTIFSTFSGFPAHFIISTGGGIDPETLGTPPNNMKVYKYVPQLKILEKADLFITHGGMNSIQESLYYGVPTILIPQQLEQALNSRIVRRKGAGIDLNPKNISPKLLIKSVEEILSNNKYSIKANELMEDAKLAGGSQKAVQVINQLI